MKLLCTLDLNDTHTHIHVINMQMFHYLEHKLSCNHSTADLFTVDHSLNLSLFTPLLFTIRFSSISKLIPPLSLLFGRACRVSVNCLAGRCQWQGHDQSVTRLAWQCQGTGHQLQGTGEGDVLQSPNYNKDVQHVTTFCFGTSSATQCMRHRWKYIHRLLLSFLVWHQYFL